MLSARPYAKQQWSGAFTAARPGQSAEQAHAARNTRADVNTEETRNARHVATVHFRSGGRHAIGGRRVRRVRVQPRFVFRLLPAAESEPCKLSSTFWSGVRVSAPFRLS